jgi:hypothetical protein
MPIQTLLLLEKRCYKNYWGVGIGWIYFSTTQVDDLTKGGLFHDHFCNK